MKKPFPKALKEGQVCEKWRAERLEAAGHSVERYYDWPKSPKCGPRCPEIGATLPDLGTAAFLEDVKGKEKATYHQNTGYWVHGVNLSDWKDYQKVAEYHALPLQLCFVQGTDRVDPVKDGKEGTITRPPPPGVYILRDNVAENHRHEPTDMIYWRVQDMEYLGPDIPDFLS